MEKETDRCPYCGGTTGYIRETTVIKRACYDWYGGRMGDMEPLYKDPSVTRCLDCGRRIDTKETVKSLDFENAKLRKYIEALLGYLDPANRQDLCNRVCPAYEMCKGKPRCMFPDWAISEAAELGIEVSND